MSLYKIVRYYERGSRRTIESGVTLEEAQAHCNDPETSSKTCTNRAGRERTRKMGAWFDGYVKIEPKRSRYRSKDRRDFWPI